MRAMTDDEVLTFLRSGSRTGKLAVVRADGRPHVSPVWFDVDDDTGQVMFLTHEDSVKGRCLRRDPRVSICVDVTEPPFHFARLDGTVTLTPFDDDPDLVRHWATETCRRYVGNDRAEAYGRRNGVPGELLVRVTPTHLTGAFGVAD